MPYARSGALHVPEHCRFSEMQLTKSWIDGMDRQRERIERHIDRRVEGGTQRRTGREIEGGMYYIQYQMIEGGILPSLTNLQKAQKNQHWKQRTESYAISQSRNYARLSGFRHYPTARNSKKNSVYQELRFLLITSRCKIITNFRIITPKYAGLIFVPFPRPGQYCICREKLTESRQRPLPYPDDQMVTFCEGVVFPFLTIPPPLGVVYLSVQILNRSPKKTVQESVYHPNEPPDSR